jgi:hypothetical protein
MSISHTHSAQAPPRQARARGVSSMLAMVFLVIFSTVALGFYAAVTIAVAISRNDMHAARARAASESGFEFLQYHLAETNVAYVNSDQYMNGLHGYLYDHLNGSQNLTQAGSTVTIDASHVISLPQTGYIPLDATASTGFRATIAPLSGTAESGRRVRVHLSGRSGTREPYVYRGIDLQFVRRSSALDYGLATKGTLVMSGGSEVLGANADGTPNGAVADVLASAASLNGKTVGGDIYTVSPSPSAVTLGTGVSVGGTSDPAVIRAAHVHQGLLAPAFPTVDTSPFIAYATTPYVSTMTTLTNVYVPASTSTSVPPPQIDLTGKTIRGVLYIKAPNNVKIGGGTNMQGIIVTDSTPAGSLATNLITISGSVAMRGVETLDPAVFGSLTTMGGSLILVPGFHLTFTGSTGVAGGSIVAGRITLSGNAGLTLAGSVIGLDNAPLTVSGSGEVTVKPASWTGAPSGLVFPPGSNGLYPLFPTFAEAGQ